MQCCCGRIEYIEQDLLINETIHQMLGKKQVYPPFCGSATNHLLKNKDAEIKRLKAVIRELEVEACRVMVELCEERGKNK